MPTTIYDDDFQGYAIGTTLPFGSWLDRGHFTASIVAGASGIPTTDRHFNIGLANVELDPTTSGVLASFSEFVALQMTQPPTFQSASLRFQNGTDPNPNNNTTILFIKIEADSTISAYYGANVLIANSGDAWYNFGSYNFLQVNVTLVDIAVSGVNHVGIILELGLNGRSVISATVTTNILSAGLVTGTAAVNKFQLAGDGNFAAYTLTTLQAIAAYPHLGTPSAKVIHSQIDLDLLADSGKMRMHHAALELDVLPDSATIRIIHALIELDLSIRNRWYISES